MSSSSPWGEGHTRLEGRLEIGNHSLNHRNHKMLAVFTSLGAVVDGLRDQSGNSARKPFGYFRVSSNSIPSSPRSHLPTVGFL